MKGSFGAFAVINLEEKLPQHCRFFPEDHVRRRRKRKRSLSEAEDKGETKRNHNDVESVICLRYNSVLHMDFIAADEMVIIEQPWVNVIATFPAAMERKLYGT